MPIAALAFQVRCLNNLTTGLMFKLIIFTEKLETEATGEASPSMVPDSPLTLHAFGISENTTTSMTLQTFLAVANPGFTKITNSTNHLKLNEFRLRISLIIICGSWLMDSTHT